MLLNAELISFLFTFFKVFSVCLHYVLILSAFFFSLMGKS